MFLRNGQVNQPTHQLHQLPGWGQAAGLDVLPMQDMGRWEGSWGFMTSKPEKSRFVSFTTKIGVPIKNGWSK